MKQNQRLILSIIGVGLLFSNQSFPAISAAKCAEGIMKSTVFPTNAIVISINDLYQRKGGPGWVKTFGRDGRLSMSSGAVLTYQNHPVAVLMNQEPNDIIGVSEQNLARAYRNIAGIPVSSNLPEAITRFFKAAQSKDLDGIMKTSWSFQSVGNGLRDTKKRGPIGAQFLELVKTGKPTFIIPPNQTYGRPFLILPISY